MNQYEKVGAFAVRALGLAMFFLGVLGPIATVISEVEGHGLPDYPADKWRACITYVLMGSVLMVIGNRIGGLLGRGLA
jgi:hypothetical protein